MNPNKKLNLFLGLILILLYLLRLKVSVHLGLGADEAHYSLYGRYPDWSYFDHPPMVGWLSFLFQKIFGWMNFESDLLARLPALLISLLTTSLVYKYTFEKWTQLQKNSNSELTPQTVALLAAVGLNLILGFNILTFMFLPDDLLLPVGFWLLTAVEKFESEKSYKSWICIGLLLGVSGLSKYVAILYVPALVLYFIEKKYRAEILKPRFWIGVVVAALLVSPVIWWNVKNSMSSLHYQTGHLLAFQDMELKNLLATVATMFVVWGVFLWIPYCKTLAGFIKKTGTLKKYFRFEMYIVITGLVFFLVSGLTTPMLPHWPALYIAILLPAALLIYFYQKGSIKKFGFFYLLPNAILVFFLLVEMSFQILPASSMALGYRDIQGWPKIMSKASELTAMFSKGHPELTPYKIALTNWTLGSRALYYLSKNTKSESRVFILDNKQDQFDIWNPTSPLGLNFIVIIEKDKWTEVAPLIDCEKKNHLEDLPILMGETEIYGMSYLECLNYKGSKL